MVKGTYLHGTIKCDKREEENVLFNNALNTFILFTAICAMNGSTGPPRGFDQTTSRSLS